MKPFSFSAMKQTLSNWIQADQPVPIEVFVRHCHYSSASAHKERFPFFSREACFENLLATLDDPSVQITFLLDTFHPLAQEHFIAKQTRFPIVEIKAGTEGESFLQMLDHVISKKLHPDTLIYFLEDDYIHQKGWAGVLREGFTLPKADYITLYDHKDKYFLPEYEALQAEVFHTASCHWRTTPSTTNTYAAKVKTLLRDLPIHREFSTGRKITADHAKFCKLREGGAHLLSSIPGWATHAEPKYASPCVDWEKVLTEK